MKTLIELNTEKNRLLAELNRLQKEMQPSHASQDNSAQWLSQYLEPISLVNNREMLQNLKKIILDYKNRQSFSLLDELEQFCQDALQRLEGLRTSKELNEEKNRIAKLLQAPVKTNNALAEIFNFFHHKADIEEKKEKLRALFLRFFDPLLLLKDEEMLEGLKKNALEQKDHFTDADAKKLIIDVISLCDAALFRLRDKKEEKELVFVEPEGVSKLGNTLNDFSVEKRICELFGNDKTELLQDDFLKKLISILNDAVLIPLADVTSIETIENKIIDLAQLFQFSLEQKPSWLDAARVYTLMTCVLAKAGPAKIAKLAGDTMYQNNNGYINNCYKTALLALNGGKGTSNWTIQTVVHTHSKAAETLYRDSISHLLQGWTQFSEQSFNKPRSANNTPRTLSRQPIFDGPLPSSSPRIDYGIAITTPQNPRRRPSLAPLPSLSPRPLMSNALELGSPRSPRSPRVPDHQPRCFSDGVSTSPANSHLNINRRPSFDARCSPVLLRRSPTDVILHNSYSSQENSPPHECKLSTSSCDPLPPSAPLRPAIITPLSLNTIFSEPNGNFDHARSLPGSPRKVQTKLIKDVLRELQKHLIQPLPPQENGCHQLGMKR